MRHPLPYAATDTRRSTRTETAASEPTTAGAANRPPIGFFAAGRAGLTRRVKAAGPTWTVQEKGRRTFSHGVSAAREQIESVRQSLEAERATEAYAKKPRRQTRRRRARMLNTCRFGKRRSTSWRCAALSELAARLAEAVAQHATPVGSGTVARTQRIPIEQRAEAAIIAWLRHQTTAYDELQIPRIKGKRREVRRMLAEQSRRLLEKYRRGQAVDLAFPLHQALLQLA